MSASQLVSDALTSSHVHATDALLALFDEDANVPGHTSAPAFARAPASSSLHPESDELVQTLHAHYCAALGSSYFMVSGSWESSLVTAPPVATPAMSHDDAVARADMSISGLFAEPQRLEEAIGPLGPGDELGREDMNMAAAPEILALFAPPEYQLDDALRRRFVPPALARREHHTLAIDSPLPEFNAGSLHLDGIEHED
ncbi:MULTISPECIES: TagK domain-containing protein [unclassified Caballeronia]|nr:MULTISPECIES: TagK domain-containing protein [unclassified Caballeronia]